MIATTAMEMNEKTIKYMQVEIVFLSKDETLQQYLQSGLNSFRKSQRLCIDLHRLLCGLLQCYSCHSWFSKSILFTLAISIQICIHFPTLETFLLWCVWQTAIKLHYICTTLVPVVNRSLTDFLFSIKFTTSMKLLCIFQQ